MPVVEINPETDARWDRYAASHPNATIYHLSAWCRVLRSTFGHEPFGLAIGDNTESLPLAGILPLAFVNRWLRGKRIVSLPLTAYCNPLVSIDQLDELIRYAQRRLPAVKHVLLQFQQTATSSLPGVPSEYVTHTLRLDDDENAIFKRFHNSSVRQRITRAHKAGLHVRWGGSEADLRAFYRLQRETRKKHGLPPHPFAFYDNMRRILMPQHLMNLPVVDLEGEVIAAAILLNFNGTYHLEYSAADARYRKHGSNQLLIWEAIRKACSQGARFFDFGRTHVTNSSLVEFKQRWGTEERVILNYCGSEMAPALAGVNKGRKIVAYINRGLPAILLDWEGILVYRYLS